MINKSSILNNAKLRKNIWALKVYVKVFTIKHWSLRLKSTLKIDIKICYVITFWRKAYAIEYCQNLTFQYVIRALFIVYRRRLAWNRFWIRPFRILYLVQGHLVRGIFIVRYRWRIVGLWFVEMLKVLFVYFLFEIWRYHLLYRILLSDLKVPFLFYYFNFISKHRYS